MKIALLALCALALVVAAVFTKMSNARYQTIIRLHAPDGEFVIEGLPFLPNEAGSSAIDVRYRYRGIELESIGYGHPDRPLYAYLRQDSARVRDLGLSTEAEWREAEHRARRGTTLYLPPSQFAAAEVDRLADFIRANQDTIYHACRNATVHGSFLLGLLKTKAHVGGVGIARLVHADRPFFDVFGSTYLLVVIHHDGSVVLTSMYKSFTSPEVATWGKMLPPRKRGGKPILVLDPITVQDGSEPTVYDSARMKKWAGNLYDKGRRLSKKYEIRP